MKNFSKFLAIVLSIAITVPMLALSAGAVDSLTVEEPQIISDTLQAVMETSTEETTRVAVWLKDIETEEALATNSMPSYQERLAAVTAAEANSTAKSDVDRSIEVKRAAFKLCYEPYTENVGSNIFTNGEIVYCSKYLPLVIAELPNERIEQISELRVVENIDYQNDDYIELSAETQSVNSAHYTIENNIQYINAGTLRNAMSENSYVNIGVIELYNPEYRSLFAGKTIVEHFPNANESAHASAVAEIMMSLAPHATFYFCSLNASGSLQTEVEWLLDNDVHVTNVSYGVNNPALFNVYENDAVYLDKITYLYGATFVIASGNRGSAGVNPPAMGYNSITVGTFDRSINGLWDYSSYNNSSSLSAAYKPDICAPGHFLFPDGGTSSGTSLSAPVVTGVVALLMSYDISVKDDFRLIKSILTASTSAAHSYTPADSEYREFGAGVVDAERARLILYHYRTAGNVAMPSPSYQTHNISLSGSKSTRISMVFDKINTEEETYTLANLNLQVYDPNGNLVASSVTTNNNVEIVEFTATTYGTYQVRIVSVNVPSGDVYALPMYGISWLQW